MQHVDEGKTGEIQKLLRKLQIELPGFQTAVVVAVEGLPITSYSIEEFDEMKELAFAAVTASLLALGEKTVMDVGRPDELMKRITIESDDLFVVSTAAGDKAVLTVVSSKDTKEGLLYYRVKEAAGQIAKLLE